MISLLWSDTMPSIQEKAVQLALANYFNQQGYTVKREVKTPVGYIDFLLYKDNKKILVEVKEAKGMKHAIGQIHSYHKYHKDAHELWIIYFTRKGTHAPVQQSFLTEPIKFISAHTLVSLEEIFKHQIPHVDESRNTVMVESLKSIEDKKDTGDITW